MRAKKSRMGAEAQPRLGCRVLLAAACAAASGCGPADPLELKVKADSYVSFSMWESHVRDRLDPGQMADFEEALQELRYRSMANGSASASDVDEAARGAIDGRSVRYVLELGLGWELGRLQDERSQLELAIHAYAVAPVAPGDAQAGEFVLVMRQKHEARLRTVNDKIASVRGKLVALNPGQDQKDLARPADAPAAPRTASPSPTDSPPQRIGRGKTQTPRNPQGNPWNPHNRSGRKEPSSA